MRQRIGFLISHPIQYYAPIFRELATHCDLTVFFAHRQTAAQQAEGGYGVAFDWDVDLLSGYKSRFLTNVARRPSTSHFAGCNTPEIVERIAEGRFDAFVVPGWSLRSYWQAIRACRRLGVPVMVRGDSQLGSPRRATVRLAKELLFPRMMKLFDGYLYVGERSRAYLEHYGAARDRLFFSPHCVDNRAFGNASSGVTKTRGRRVLFVGRLVPFKRPLDIVKAAAQLATAGRPVELVVAGAGELEGELRAAARAGGVEATFLGFVNQSRLPEVYAGADVLVLPSGAEETWGLVVNEAMACGIPAVVSDAVGCGPDLVEPGATGEVAPLDDVAGLAAAIDRVLDLDPQTSRRCLAERMAVYSPERAALGVVAAGAALAGRTRLG